MGEGWSIEIGSRENQIGKWSERGLSLVELVRNGWVLTGVRWLEKYIDVVWARTAW